MAKIRDLAISTIPPARPVTVGAGYWMCQDGQWTNAYPPEGGKPGRPECHPSYHDKDKGKDHDKDKDKKNVHGMPQEAVIQLKQQLQRQISTQLH
jgi:hypothetical protein